jgi:dTDP-4-dehydrorhamnose 3,5-epimerase
MMKPKIIEGGIAIDDRGSVRFVNNFTFDNVKRFYTIQNHKVGFVRAWHGHQREGKFLFIAKGSALVGTINISTEVVEKFVLSEEKPQILWIPPNYYNGFMTLREDTILFIFSTSTLEESIGDDIRQPYDKWNIWKVEQR